MTIPSNSNALRQAFFDFFAERGHEIVKSCSLVPQNDPSLLFVNAGMVQFKDVFLGSDIRDYSRAVSSQRCVRAGGKHNDLENVGHTARHHTFFEMLGNFSFGDYFKREAIQFAWSFLTEVLQLPEEKLWVTVYKDDHEAEDIWLKTMKVSPERFSRCSEADNFWSMGDTGPCGPCTEIFYDHGPEVTGGPPGSPDEDGDRYVEIWNLVFMQYNRNAEGKMTPLPKPSVDTGMGLERLCAVMQGVHSNYDTDLFSGIIATAGRIAGLSDFRSDSLKVMADHIRATSFLILDGVSPANEGRGYVLRRIMRRAIRHGHQLGIRNAFFFKLVSPLVDKMGEAYPELRQSQSLIEDVIKQEEQQFAKTLSTGMKILEEAMHNSTDKKLAGDVVFKLYDTYGFPVDLTADVAREKGFSIDTSGFEKHMQAQRDLSQAASQFTASTRADVVLTEKSHFTGYDHTEDQASILSLYHDNQKVETLSEGQSGFIVLDKTPFYAESGGQVGDTGELSIENIGVFEVHDTQKSQQAIIHFGVVKQGEMKAGGVCHAKVDAVRRQAIRLNHSATHLLHSALREIVGPHVTQKGSLVAPDRLRFDFSHSKALSTEDLNRIELLINEKIREDLSSDVSEKTPDEAITDGALALFGERYDKKIRVLKMGDFSHEVCGGTHVDATGEIGLFKILSESGVASGIRRIEAITGADAIRYTQQQTEMLNQLSNLLKAKPEALLDRVNQLQDKLKQTEKEISKLNNKLSSAASGDLAQEAQDIAGYKVIAKSIEGQSAAGLRQMVDDLKGRMDKTAIILATVSDSKVTLIAGVTKDACEQISAGNLVNFVAQQVDGKGGGRPDMAQGGGQNPDGLAAALATVPQWVQSQAN